MLDWLSWAFGIRPRLKAAKAANRPILVELAMASDAVFALVLHAGWFGVFLDLEVNEDFYAGKAFVPWRQVLSVCEGSMGLAYAQLPKELRAEGGGYYRNGGEDQEAPYGDSED